MKRSDALTLLMAALLLIPPGACADDAVITAGRDLYLERCQRCHGIDPALRTRPADVAALLRGGSVRSHRFTLSDPELGQLRAYLASLDPKQK